MGVEVVLCLGHSRRTSGLFGGGLDRNREDDPGTLLGNYLSGRVARGDHDTAAAADFYSSALVEDPKNELILEQTFLLETASADWDNAIQLARNW